MIDYKDFVPKMVGQARLLGEPEFERLQDVIRGCNEWIASSGAEVLNVETVVLPRLHHPHEQGSEDVNIREHDDFMTPWNQFIRVWFRTR